MKIIKSFLCIVLMLCISISAYASNCSHEYTIKDASNYAPEYDSLNDTSHMVEEFYDKICETCGEIVEEKVPEEPWEAEHNIIDGICEDCGYGGNSNEYNNDYADNDYSDNYDYDYDYPESDYPESDENSNIKDDLQNTDTYYVEGHLHSASLNKGTFIIEYSENFAGARVTPEYPLNIEVDIGDISFDIFRDPATIQSNYVRLKIKDNFDGTYHVITATIANKTSSTADRSSDIEPSDEIKVILDGQLLYFDVPPIIISGRTLVPVRAIFEALGAEVLWDNEERKVTAHRGPVTVNFNIGNYNMLLNGVNYTIDSCPIIKNDRTLIPLRAVSESFGCEVEWVAEEKKVIITSTDSVEDLKGIYRVNGRFYPESLPEGKFVIHFAENFAGNQITSDYPVDIKVNIGNLDPNLFYNSETQKSYYVYIIIKDNQDGTYQVLEHERRLYLPEDD